MLADTTSAVLYIPADRRRLNLPTFFFSFETFFDKKIFGSLKMSVRILTTLAMLLAVGQAQRGECL
jgi:hypothetical protein